MPRMARIVVPGIPHHITQRGVRSMRVFSNDQDRLEYLQLLHRQGSIHGLHFASYVLMDNHVHLIAIPDREDSLRKAVGEAHRRYTLGINRRLEKKGYFFQGRPFSCPMDEDYFRTALRYVERNPVRAKIVLQPWEYAWSSAGYHTGFKSTDPLIDYDCHSVLGINMEEWQKFLQSDSPEMESIQKKTKTGRPCGSKSFVDDLERITGRILHPRPTRKRKSKDFDNRNGIVSPYSAYG
jgi:putative transposase